MSLAILPPRSRLEIVNPDGGTVIAGGSPAHAVVVEAGRGTPGPQGPTGPIGGTLSRVAAIALSGHRAVRAVSATEVNYCDATDPAAVYTFLGVTSGAASAGAAIDVIHVGELIEPTWNWTPNLPVFCGANGVLTQTYDPAWAWCLVVGVAETSTKVYIQARTPVATAP